MRTEPPVRTLESVEQELLEKWSKVRSYTAKQTTETRQKDRSRRSHAKGTGKVEYLREGDRWYMRSEINLSNQSKDYRGEKTKESRSTSLIDGEYSYILMDSQPPAVIKLDIDPKSEGTVQNSFAALRLSGEPQLRPDEVVEGRPVYVVDIQFQAAGGPPWKITYYFDQESGIVVKTVTADDAGSTYGLVVYSDLKINVDLKPEQFRFEAPEGAVIDDKTSEAVKRAAEAEAAKSGGTAESTDGAKPPEATPAPDAPPAEPRP